MDDITPNMNWKQFWKYINLFKKNNVKPLLGVVPDNCDKELNVEEENYDFWRIIKSLQSNGTVEIAQHGYEHKNIGQNNYFSEFVGLPYEQQLEKIKKGRDVLINNNIYTDIWMAPWHSYDDETIKTLKHLKFKKITDSIALYPFKCNDMLFVPQQLWKPRYFPFGILTICLHINEINNQIFERVKKHVESNADIISFKEASNYSNDFYKIINYIYKKSYEFYRLFKGCINNVKGN